MHIKFKRKEVISIEKHYVRFEDARPYLCVKNKKYYLVLPTGDKYEEESECWVIDYKEIEISRKDAQEYYLFQGDGVHSAMCGLKWISRDFFTENEAEELYDHYG